MSIDSMKRDRLQGKLQQFLKEFRMVCSACRRDPNDITLLFATKYLSKEELVEFMANLSNRNISIGENRVQDAMAKFVYIQKTDSVLLENVRKIMIGTLQKNKINQAIVLFDEIHSVDSVDLAVALDKRLAQTGKSMPIFLQINVSNEETKHGFTIQEFEETYPFLRELTSIRVVGLMTIAPHVDNPEEVRPLFRTLRQLADKYGLKTSMGMSNDWKIAVEEGTDEIRVGSRIFY